MLAAVSVSIRVKGTVFAGLLRATTKVGVRLPRPGDVSAGLGQALATRDFFATSWYPVEWYRELLAHLLQASDPATLREIVQASTRDNISTVHRLLMRAFSPDTLLRQSARLFSTFFDAELSCKMVGPGLTQVEWRGCHGFDKTCWNAQIHTVEELVAMTGARLWRRTVLSGGGDKDASLLLELHWS